ncbi:uncharacterized protein [Triticum aestivum]|uniref:uncharacterized protein isoform X1 n=1 Tax=Triticum aestivum TaxID=4565 RepID=UPI001D0036A9|nr:uncharacterized protein LOC123054331 isoform X1 [Triticum aestivum]XP_044334011.1 uncharacterized protein LOC123054331 isoform X1 [Triticum aestivum]XP_044334012.1 uncharacterized protein LOC123054331 isoform X1 [Triticum aestivum]XP_044334013.1 uncharacterized protein LOC123054331 isoform X1 [Triticum aestivum]XP_044334014.1 uncharacterized protein LOC123054331 isoform X1 [Triticum aestivum]
MPKVSGSEHQSMSKFSFGNKSVSFHSAIANGVFAKSDGIPEVAISDAIPEVAKTDVAPEVPTSDGIPEVATSDGIPEVVVQQESRPAVTPDVVTPIVPPAVIFGGLHNPVVLSSSSTPAKVRNEAVAKEGHVPVCALFSKVKTKDSIAAVHPKVFLLQSLNVISLMSILSCCFQMALLRIVMRKMLLMLLGFLLLLSLIVLLVFSLLLMSAITPQFMLMENLLWKIQILLETCHPLFQFACRSISVMSWVMSSVLSMLPTDI